MRLNAPREAAVKNGKESNMIKIRVSGLPEEVADFADALEATGCVLERSGDYKNRGDSRYVRVYIDAEVPRRDSATRAIARKEF